MPKPLHLVKLNVIPSGSSTGAASLKLKIYSATEFEDNYRFWNAYSGCDMEALYRLKVNGRWFWPRPGDNRFPFLNAEELWGQVTHLAGDGQGIPASLPTAPDAFPESGSWVKYMDTEQCRTRSRTMGSPYLENGVWWIRVMGEKLPVPCNAVCSES